MKKTGKLLVIGALAAVTAIGFAGCGESDQTGTAYGLVHTGSYVGKASVTLSGETVKDVTLQEFVFPDNASYVKVAEGTPEDDIVTFDGKEFYKTLKIGNAEFTFDEAAGSYKTGETLFAAWAATEENAKTYVEAALENEIVVLVGGEERNDLVTNAVLNKELNGYWGEQLGGLGWIANRDATVAYVKANGVKNLLNLTQNAADVWMDGTVSTNATWVDLNSKDTDGYLSYAQLITNAANAASAAT